MSVSQPHYSLRVLTTILLISVGIYLLLAVITYTPFDPGWSHLSSETLEVSNAAGISGAWLADLLYGMVGWAAIVLPLFVLCEAISIWWIRSDLTRPFRYVAEFFMMLMAAALCYLLMHRHTEGLHNAAGGIVGFELAERLQTLLGYYGSLAALIGGILLLLTLVFKIQWLKTGQMIKNFPHAWREVFYRDSQLKQHVHDLSVTTAQSPNAVSITAHQLNEIESSAVEAFDQHTQHQTLKSDLNDTFTPSTEPEVEDEIALTGYQASTPILPAAPILNPHDLDQKDSAQPKIKIQSELGFNPTQAQFDQQSLHSESTQLSQASDMVTSTDSSEPLETPLRSREHDKIAQLLARADEQFEETTTAALASEAASMPASVLDWSDDQIFDELLAAVPQDTDPVSSLPDDSGIENRRAADTMDADKDETVLSSSVIANQTERDLKITRPAPIAIDPISDDAVLAARNAYQQDDESSARPSAPTESRSMQVVQARQLLSPLPSLDLLDTVNPDQKVHFSREQLLALSELLEIKLQDFNVKARVVEAQPGPVVTRFELELAPGVKASKVTGISSDLARSMSMASVRVVEVIPGKPYIGIEVPNRAREMVRLIELLQTQSYRDPNGLISMAMGKDIAGHPIITDLAKAPHMLVAGTTGSGKSVAVNAMILSMLLKYTPKELRLILIDPKQLELANYEDIPHLLTPVVTDMKDAVNALNWCVNEMERRYKLMAYLKIRKINDYNRKVEEALARGEDLIDPTWKPTDSVTQDRAPRLQPLPMIVIVADEFADMIMQVGKKAEELITRLAQKSRAAGIHLLLATQRPSVDVITGLIKANIPTRVALRVNSRIDSRTILDAGGAEDLLGHGDMLFLGPGKIEPERAHGAFISDDEVNRVCDAWRERGSPNYVDEILTPYDEDSGSSGFEDSEGGEDRDAMYDQCVAFVLETRKISISSLQRKFSLGYNRAARIVDQMEANGIVSPMNSSGKRDILI